MVERLDERPAHRGAVGTVLGANENRQGMAPAHLGAVVDPMNAAVVEFARRQRASRPLRTRVSARGHQSGHQKGKERGDQYPVVRLHASTGRYAVRRPAGSAEGSYRPGRDGYAGSTGD